MFRMPIEQMPGANSRKRALDDLVNAYVSWREESRAVREAYDRCKSRPGHDTDGAFWAYLAALDREEHAANVYALNVKSVLGTLDIKAHHVVGLDEAS